MAGGGSGEKAVRSTEQAGPGRTNSPAKARKAASAAPEGAGLQPSGSDGGSRKGSRTMSVVSKGTNFIVTAILCYSVFVASQFRTILWPKFPDLDESARYIPKHQNVFVAGDMLSARLWVDKTAFPPKKPPLAEFDFRYQWENFQTVSHKLNASITQAQMDKGQNLVLSAEVKHKQSGRIAKAKGGLVKSIKPAEMRPKYHLLSGAHCPEDPEPAFGKKGHIAKGIPKMEVRLVFDTTAYPYPYANSPYTPPLFVDEFWMTNDQLVKLNTTGENSWESEVHFNLMGDARWRFQRHMEFSFEQNAKLFGEDSEEMLQMRDLFANTNPHLLVATLVVSVLHMVFEFLAFKNDVEFFQECDVETLNKYVSVQSIVVGIFTQILLLLYLWDESANILVLASSVVGILIDVWKVQRAMTMVWGRLFGFLPVPMLVSKVKKEKQDDFDSQAMKWLALLLVPPIVAYSCYTLAYDCHRGWYSYFLVVSSSCVYSLGFVLMTPQVFINYKHKTVAYLPWRKFIYRAINTFIDDLFALVIRMPTMHRLSCFRDDIVFVIYLYQRQIYKVDKARAFDEDGYVLSSAEMDARSAADTVDPSTAHVPETKKVK